MSPQDHEIHHKIHHKIFECHRKFRFNMYFINEFPHKTMRKSCGGGGGAWNILNFTTRPRENLVVGVGCRLYLISPRDHEIYHKILNAIGNTDFMSGVKNILLDCDWED